MARLIYSAIASLDGYVADRDGRFDWAAPDAEVHAFVNEVRLELELVAARRFGGGMVHLHHRTVS